MNKKKDKLAILGPEDAPGIFALARSYYDTGEGIVLRYVEQDKTPKQMDSNTLAVAVTNIILSFELSIKGLILVTTGNYETGHKLTELVSKLPSEIQVDIRKLFKNEKVKVRGDLPIIRHQILFQNSENEYDPWKEDITLDTFLRAHNDGFVTWRYYFQPEVDKTIYADFALMFVFNEVIHQVVNKHIKQ